MPIAEEKFQFFACNIGRIELLRFANAVLRESLPELFRFVELNQRARKILRLVGYENVFVVGEVHSLHSD